MGRHGRAVSVPACRQDLPRGGRPPEGGRHRRGPVPGPAPCGATGALSDSSHGVRLKDAPPSTSNVCVRSQLAVVLARRGVLRTGHAVFGACALPSAATSLRAFGPGLPHRDSFRPCRFSRLRRLAPRTRCRSVAPCSRSWGSPGCKLDPPSHAAPRTALVKASGPNSIPGVTETGRTHTEVQAELASRRWPKPPP
jgi:hypothetical protein